MKVKCITEDDWKTVIENKMQYENAMKGILDLVNQNNLTFVQEEVAKPVCKWFNPKCWFSNKENKEKSPPPTP